MLKVIQASDSKKDNLYSFIIWKKTGESWQLFGNDKLRQKFIPGTTISENFRDLGFEKVVPLKRVPDLLINSVF